MYICVKMLNFLQICLTPTHADTVLLIIFTRCRKAASSHFFYLGESTLCSHAMSTAHLVGVNKLCSGSKWPLEIHTASCFIDTIRLCVYACVV